MNSMTRREAIETIIAGSLTAALVNHTQRGPVMAEETRQNERATLQLAPAYRGTRQVKPLPFDTVKLSR